MVAGGVSRLLIAGGGALLGTLVVVLAILSPSPRPARGGVIQATPIASPVVPQASDCTVAPRTLPIVDGTPGPAISPTNPPAATPAARPADAETVLAITATVRESIACSNAGDFARELALFSDRYVRALFTGPEAIDPGELAGFVATPPVALASQEQLALVAVREVRFLDDGRASAVVVTRNARMTFTDLLVFVRAGDRWLIDEFRPAPRPPATPAASPAA